MPRYSFVTKDEDGATPAVHASVSEHAVTDSSYPVAEVSQRLGVSQHSLYEWKKKFAASNAKGNDEAEEIRRLKKELARVTEERDILKNDHVLRPACAR
ncbi:transposase [Rhizobium azooxidifex]|uniref:Transposase n=1 Tax=Mycoplana azooxidifex TaxID=1636188 RepID=A0A7W6DCI8_9HYPH|nr:transposase [Mycoplana azooxidifex]